MLPVLHNILLSQPGLTSNQIGSDKMIGWPTPLSTETFKALTGNPRYTDVIEELLGHNGS